MFSWLVLRKSKLKLGGSGGRHLTGVSWPPWLPFRIAPARSIFERFYVKQSKAWPSVILYLQSA